LDAVVVVLNSRARLLLNRSGNNHHWLAIDLTGAASNRDGLGARIKVTTGQHVQFNHATTTVSYNSASDRRVHFGLGAAAIADKVEVWWPSGAKQELTGVRADQILKIVEPAPAAGNH
jgi:hypothetical protein